MKAVCYARTSTKDQAREEKVSIPDQINWAKKFALERGWDWVGEYIEPGVTGDTEPEERESLSRLLKDAKDKKFDIVLIYHSSRLAREADIGLRICRVLGQLRIQMHFRNAPIEPVAPDKFSWGINIGSQYMTAFSFIGDFQENVARSERVRSGFQGLAKRGVLVFAPYGYKKIPGIIIDESGKQKYIWHFEIEPSKALMVERIFDMYINEGGSLRQIMLTLNKEGIPSPSGKISSEAWSAATIKNILSNEVYLGKVRWGRKLGGKYLQGKNNSGKQRRILTPRESWIFTEGSHPAIIPFETFTKAQEKLMLRYALKGRAIASKGLLTGLLYCGLCGRKAYFKARIERKKNNYLREDYVCSSYSRSKTCKRHVITSKKIHKIVISELDKISKNPKYREKLLKQNKHNNEENMNSRLGLLLKEKNQQELSQSRILRAYETGNLALEEFGKAKQRLDGEVLRIDEEISKIENKMLEKTKSEESNQKFLDILNDFKLKFDKADFSVKKEFLQSLISSIRVKPNSIQINYRI